MAWDRRRRRGSETGPLAFVTNNLWLTVCTLAALALLVVARAQETFFEDVRAAVGDASAPVMEALAGPAGEVRRFGEGVGSLFGVYEENQRLRETNARLTAELREVETLRRKLRRYEELLKIPEEKAVTSVAARVIADASGPFVQTVLVNVGGDQGVVKGQAVVDERGLLGRVVSTGKRSSRVLLLTDLNSRIPVMIEGADLKAILVGDNSGKPLLAYLPPGSRITAGARVFTTPDGGAFPPGVPVGRVSAGSTVPRVDLYTTEGRADFVRVLEYTAPVDVDVPEGEPAPQTAPAPAKPAKPKPPATAPQPQAAPPAA